MPLFKTARPLKALCMEYIARNINQMCTGHTMTQEVDQGIFDFIEPRLSHYLPCLHHVLGSKHTLRCIVISLWSESDADSERHLTQIGTKGDILEELHFLPIMSDNLVPTVICTLQQLPFLVKLTLRLADITETLIAGITNNCALLTEVTLSSLSFDERCLDMFTACTRLEELVIDCTAADTDPDTHHAQGLLSLPRLRVFRYDNLTREVLRIPSTMQLSLTDYAEQNGKARWAPTFLEHVVKVCPLITCIHVDLFGEEDVSLLRFLRHLSRLSLSLSPVIAANDIATELRPVFRAVGHNMTSLRLEIGCVDLADITEYCTGLEVLNISSLHTMRKFAKKRTAILPQLKTLKLSLSPTTGIDDGFPAELIQAIGANLQKISLKDCQLSDAEFNILLKACKFNSVRELSLSQVRGLTAWSLHDLFAAPNPLETVKLYMCPRISRPDINSLRHRAKLENLAVDVIIDHHDWNLSYLGPPM
ncbi:hypothetical protein ISCGN_013313 [Ixodes scapularis]|uniref:RNI-like protein n=1 Tax=Ixodes scapularis TaxID=6945 RepID=B7Q6K9_IXOSC|nr:hypothetical protein IscW_ISCW010395 [Ixodes scapularis]|eukprot:XP_002403109.1 hypothetical protein IscW_ISCW010395 [Ixodes scapularis]